MDKESLFIEELDGLTAANPETAAELELEAYRCQEPEYDSETYDFRQ